MRDDQTQHGADAQGGRDEIRDPATLMRAGADGELTPAEQARLDEHLAANQGDVARVTFERDLRSACCRAMGSGTECCPDALRAKIERQVAESSPAYAQGVESRADQTRSRSFWNSRRMAPVLGAAAAIIAMFAVGAVLITQTGTTPGAGSADGTAGLVNVAYRNELAQFIADEHDRCWESESAADRKFVMKDRDAVVEGFKELLGGAMHIPALDQRIESIKFRGGGKCHLPKTKGAAHLRWDIPAQDGHAASGVSMFVSPVTDQLDLQEGVAYAVNTAECGAEGSTLLLWTSEGMMFCLIAESETGGCDKFRGAMGAPEKTEGL